MAYPEGRIAGDGGFGLRGMIVLSFLAHFLIIAILTLSPSLPTPNLTFGPVYSVQLVSMPTGRPESKTGDASLKELMNISPSREPLIQKESVNTLPATPLAPVETRKKSVSSVDAAVDTIRKNVQSAASPPAPVAASKGAEKVMPALPLPAGRQGDAELNAVMSNYYALIWSRIKGAWALPQGILPRENIEAVVHARIMRDGTINNVGLEKSSGNRYFDESALRTVKKASPFPAIPEGIREGSIEVGIRFHSREFK